MAFPLKGYNIKTGEKYDLTQKPKGSGFIPIDRSQPKYLRYGLAQNTPHAKALNLAKKIATDFNKYA